VQVVVLAVILYVSQHLRAFMFRNALALSGSMQLVAGTKPRPNIRAYKSPAVASYVAHSC